MGGRHSEAALEVDAFDACEIATDGLCSNPCLPSSSGTGGLPTLARSLLTKVSSQPVSRAVAVGAVMVAGALFGALTSAVNRGFGPASEYLSKVVGNQWLWLLAGYFACMLGSTWKTSAVRGVQFLWPAVVAYYCAESVAGAYTYAPRADPLAPPRFDLVGAVTDVGFYLALGAATSGGLALVLWVMRRGGLIGLLGALAVPGFIAVSALTMHFQARHQPHIPTDPISLNVSLRVGLAALAAIIVLCVRHVWSVGAESRAARVGRG